MAQSMQPHTRRSSPDTRPDPSAPEPAVDGALGNAALLERLRDAGSLPTDEGGFDLATRGPGGEVPYLGFMQSAFGQDFGGVRAHLGGETVRRGLGEIGADAAASKNVIAFSSARPDREQVAHELCHIVQEQRGSGAVQADSRVSGPGDVAEKEAREVGRAVATTGEAPAIEAAPAAGTQRDPGSMNTSVRPQPPDMSRFHPVEFAADRDTRLLRQLHDGAASGSTADLLAVMEVEGFRADDHRSEVEAELVRRAPQFGVGEVLAMRVLAARSLVLGSQAWRAAERARTAALAVLADQRAAEQARLDEAFAHAFNDDYEIAVRFAAADRRMATRPPLPAGLDPARQRRIDRLTDEIVENTIDRSAELETLRRMSHAGPVGVLALTINAISGRGGQQESVSRALAFGEPCDGVLMMAGGALEARNTARSMAGQTTPDAVPAEVRPSNERRGIDVLRGPPVFPRNQADGASGAVGASRVPTTPSWGTTIPTVGSTRRGSAQTPEPTPTVPAPRPTAPPRAPGDRTAMVPPEPTNPTVARPRTAPISTTSQISDDERPTPVQGPTRGVPGATGRAPLVPGDQAPLHTTVLPGQRAEITAEEARVLFRELAELQMPDGAGGQIRVPYRHPEDGCYDRAHVMADHMRTRGVVADKIFAMSRTPGLNVASEFAQDTFGGGQRPNVPWRYHVAPITRVRGADGTVSDRVFDPSIADEPLSVAAWTARMAPGRVFTPLSIDDVEAMVRSGVARPSVPVPDNMDATFTAHRRVYYPDSPLRPGDSTAADAAHQRNQPHMQEFAAIAQVRDLAGALRNELAAPHVSADAIVRVIQAHPDAQSQFRFGHLFPSLTRDIEAAVSPSEWVRIAPLLP
jgi:hypothetical protein